VNAVVVTLLLVHLIVVSIGTCTPAYLACNSRVQWQLLQYLISHSVWSLCK